MRGEVSNRQSGQCKPCHVPNEECDISVTLSLQRVHNGWIGERTEVPALRLSVRSERTSNAKRGTIVPTSAVRETRNGVGDCDFCVNHLKLSGDSAATTVPAALFQGKHGILGLK
jgi:hypothetical protein